MKATIEGNELVLRFPLPKTPLSPSKTGKTLIVASSNGNKTTEAEFDGQKIVVGVNAYIYPAGRGK